MRTCQFCGRSDVPTVCPLCNRSDGLSHGYTPGTWLCDCMFFPKKEENPDNLESA